MNKTILIFLVLLPSLSLAADFGIFNITGFAKIDATRAANQCSNCQFNANEDRHRPWADELAQGVPYGTANGNLTLFQPYIGTKEFNLGGGFKIKGLLSQRWRDGKQDIQGVLYERNATVLHEDYGLVQLGAFPTRGWSTADFPYGTNLGIADAWASSGAGYGLLTNAVRYGSPLLDVGGGDLYLEATHDGGHADAKVRKPAFYELYAKYVKGPWMVDAMAQSAENGQAMAWGHGPFIGVSTTQPFNGNIVDGNRQSIVMLMARYQLNAKTDLFGGVRHNRWSGSKGVITGETTPGSGVYTWNNMFNVDNATATGRGYSASTTDFSVGVIHRFMPKWSVRAGGVYLGKASTSNPVERGQSNDMMLGTLGLGYEVQPGMSVYGFVGAVQYGRQGLAPLSMPSHASFTGVDSRVAKSGNWAGVGVVYILR
jgi:hypothetical protein